MFATVQMEQELSLLGDFPGAYAAADTSIDSDSLPSPGGAASAQARVGAEPAAKELQHLGELGGIADV